MDLWREIRAKRFELKSIKEMLVDIRGSMAAGPSSGLVRFKVVSTREEFQALVDMLKDESTGKSFVSEE